jgi:hypothetical protein
METNIKRDMDLRTDENLCNKKRKDIPELPLDYQSEGSVIPIIIRVKVRKVVSTAFDVRLVPVSYF